MILPQRRSINVYNQNFHISLTSLCACKRVLALWLTNTLINYMYTWSTKFGTKFSFLLIIILLKVKSFFYNILQKYYAISGYFDTRMITHERIKYEYRKNLTEQLFGELITLTSFLMWILLKSSSCSSDC